MNRKCRPARLRTAPRRAVARGAPAARSLAPASRWKSAARRRRCRARTGSPASARPRAPRARPQRRSPHGPPPDRQRSRARTRRPRLGPPRRGRDAGPALRGRPPAGERTMNRAALPYRRPLVTDRGNQRMGEPHTRLVQQDNPFLGSRLERVDARGPIAYTAATNSTVGRASAATWRRTSAGLGWQPGEATAEELAQALGTRNARPAAGLASVRTSSRPSSRRRTGCRLCLDYTSELRPRQVQPEPILEQIVDRRPGSADQPRATPAAVREGALELERSREARGLTQRDKQADPLIAQAPKRDRQDPAEEESSHCTSSSAIRTGPRSASSLRTSRKANPMARGSGGSPPGSASRGQPRAPAAQRRKGGRPPRRGPERGDRRARRRRARLRPRRCDGPGRAELAPAPARRRPPRGSSCRSPLRRREAAPSGPDSYRPGRPGSRRAHRRAR